MAAKRASVRPTKKTSLIDDLSVVISRSVYGHVRQLGGKKGTKEIKKVSG